MNLEFIEEEINAKSLRDVLNSKKLARLGDLIGNFIYSCVRIGKKDISGSIRVWDSSLTKAMEIANLRKAIGRKVKPDEVSDAAEALLAYAYFTKVLTLDEMVEYLSDRLNTEDFEFYKIEKDACAQAFGELLSYITVNIAKERRFE
ncbi:MAG: hypothetical protein OEZ01_02495 [Candidatus Heimdallarchaeota archaeon]|nr:hypothetical protein [Candidatus Heimdallarchaeota archaeon]MDH5644845.1 hypothetical protein [Candidatus Heimdallarchaeota archaeon]